MTVVDNMLITCYYVKIAIIDVIITIQIQVVFPEQDELRDPQPGTAWPENQTRTS